MNETQIILAFYEFVKTRNIKGKANEWIDTFARQYLLKYGQLNGPVGDKEYNRVVSACRFAGPELTVLTEYERRMTKGDRK